MSTQTQEDMVLGHLAAGNTITPIEALNLFSCFRLSARVLRLKERGHNIVNEYESSNGKRYARYRLMP